MRLLRKVCGPAFMFAGALHFVKPRAYQKIVPPYLPAPEALVYLSGIAEIVGGAGLVIPATRRWAGWWLAATLVAIFPANLHMALHPEQYARIPGGAKALRGRLPIQILLIFWVLNAGRAGERP
jgi:uncharacterized membrane protein